MVASVAALLAERGEWDTSRLFDVALAAHREAQGGGSGIDVAASVFGGWSCCRLEDRRLAVAPWRPPSGLVVEVWWSRTEAVTSVLLAAVRALAAMRPSVHASIMDELRRAAEQGAAAKTVDALTAALRAQAHWLSRLGDEAAVPIVPIATRALADHAHRAGGAFIPSGAGGGDVLLHVAASESTDGFRAHAADLGLTLLPMRIGAAGASVKA